MLLRFPAFLLNTSHDHAVFPLNQALRLRCDECRRKLNTLAQFAAHPAKCVQLFPGPDSLRHHFDAQITP